MKYSLDITEDSKHGEASRAAMQTYARWMEHVDFNLCQTILEAVHKERRKILGIHSNHVPKN